MGSQNNLRSISVLIPDGETWDTVKVMRCLSREPEIKVHILAKTILPLARFCRYCSGFHHHTSKDDEDWIRVIRSIVQNQRIDVILPVTENGVEFVARNRTAISEFVAIPPISDFDLITRAHDKWSLYRFAVQNGFPVPASVLIGKAGEASVASLDIDSVKFPALLKPTSLDGGYGIVEVKGASDLARAWNNERIIKGYPYMLQSYVPGVDLCLQVFCKAGEILEYTVQKSLLLSEDAFGPQRIMEFAEDKETVELGRRLVSAMGFEGIACIDFRIDESNRTLVILEINPRFGQAILGSLIAGVNFPLLACFGALGLEYPRMQYKTTKYAHPVPSTKILLSRILGKNRSTLHLRWSESGLRFTCRDPLPAIAGMMFKIGNRLKMRISRKRPSSNNTI
jgi:predicted ATP-grasp superfamily ATP-dependent carboligase